MLVDVAIDQGGCFETSHATTHADPVYMVDGVVHYCVANMPGAVARTSTFAAQQRHHRPRAGAGGEGLEARPARQPAPAERPERLPGQVTYEAVARDLGYDYVAPASLLG